MSKKLSNLFRIREDIDRRLYVILGIIPFVILFLFWIILTYGKLVLPVFLPTPTAVLKDLGELFKNGFLTDIGASLFRVFTGFLLSAVIAVPLGILMGSFKLIDAFYSPLVTFVRYLPAAAFIPLLILWVGIGHLEKILLLFIGIFFYLLILITIAVQDVRHEYLDAAYTLGAKKKQVLLNVIVPASLPGIYEALRTMMGVGWTYIVVVEMVAATSGIGKMIMDSQRFMRTGRVIAGIITIGLIGIICDFIFMIFYPILFKWVGKKGKLSL